MKLTESNLRKMIKQVLREDVMPFPPPPIEESEEEVEESLGQNQQIIRFFENDEKDLEEDCGSTSDGDHEDNLVIGEEDMEESLSLERVVHEEISKYIKKKR